MKSNRINVPCFHKRKTDSLKNPSKTFYDADESFKLSAMNSVSRGVKHVDISFLTGTDLNKLRMEPLQQNESIYDTAHDNLKEVRRKYDEANKLNVKLQEKIDRMKQYIHKLTIVNGEYYGQVKQGKLTVGALDDRLLEMRTLLQEAITEKKVLFSMERRHKADRVFFDKRRFDYEQELTFLKKHLHILKRQGLEVGASEDRSSEVHDKLGRELERQSLQREQHIRSVEAMIDERHDLKSQNQAREADLHYIAERAMQDKDQNEKQWRQILLTHTFVNKMLRNKIDKQMYKFRVVQFAFKQIKTATGVTDAKALIDKYLNKEMVYGELLGKIAENQKTIEHLKNQTEELIRNQKEFQMELEVLQSIKIKSQDLHSDIKTLEKSDIKSLISQTLQAKIGRWLVRQLKKLSAIDNKHQQLQIPKSHQKIMQCFTQYLSITSNQIDKATSENIISKQTHECFPTRENELMVAMIPRKVHKNQKNEQMLDVDDEETSPTGNVEEQEVINSQREELLRANDKFMKELRRKKEEAQHALHQKTYSKKEKTVKVQQPNKEEHYS